MIVRVRRSTTVYKIGGYHVIVQREQRDRAERAERAERATSPVNASSRAEARTLDGSADRLAPPEPAAVQLALAFGVGVGVRS